MFHKVLILLLLVTIGMTACENEGAIQEPFEYMWRELITDQSTKRISMYDIAVGGDYVMALGPTGIFRSKDGLSWWSEHGVGGGDQLVWADSAFYVFSSNGHFVSSDGSQWEILATPSYWSYDFADWFDTMFIASSGGMQIQTCMCSKDGIDWVGTYATTGHPFLEMAKRDSLFITVGYRSMISRDAINWENLSMPSNVHWLYSITYNDSLYVAVGDHGAVVISSNSRDWQRVPSCTGRELRSVVWNGKLFVAVGGARNVDAVIITSSDGVNWKVVHEHIGGMLYGVVWFRDKFIAVGENGLIVISEPTR